jgi:hypothetical protein
MRDELCEQSVFASCVCLRSESEVVQLLYCMTHARVGPRIGHVLDSRDPGVCAYLSYVT